MARLSGSTHAARHPCRLAAAITLGGQGAVFWMWAIALVGMATSLVECSLAQLFKRREPDGMFRGGLGRSIIYGLGHEFRWLAVLMLLPTWLRLLRDFQKQPAAGVDRPVFNPDDFPDLHIDREAWTSPGAKSG